MWLEAVHRVRLTRCGGAEQFVVPWTVDIRSHVKEPRQGESDARSVGRILADAISRYDIQEAGEDVWQVADEDSSGLEAAWASLIDEKGEFRVADFQGLGDPAVYVYRFVLHPDFAEWRLVVMDAFCRLFGSDGLILAQHNTTVYSDTEFETLGFRPLALAAIVRRPTGFSDTGTRFMVRDNACAQYGLTDYPAESVHAERRHEEWLEQQANWNALSQ